MIYVGLKHHLYRLLIENGKFTDNIIYHGVVDWEIGLDLIDILERTEEYLSGAYSKIFAEIYRCIDDLMVNYWKLDTFRKGCALGAFMSSMGVLVDYLEEEIQFEVSTSKTMIKEVLCNLPINSLSEYDAQSFLMEIVPVAEMVNMPKGVVEYIHERDSLWNVVSMYCMTISYRVDQLTDGSLDFVLNWIASLRDRYEAFADCPDLEKFEEE